MDDKFKDLPQLAVGLDSLDDSANYIFILDAQEGKDYYCPCCKGLIKPRAYKRDINYQVQPHFYHVNGGCSEETYVHYICKTWLFEKGCKFIVSSKTYEVKNVEIEKTLHTSFGDYRPDIIITTTSDKVFYFEIKVTNKKTDFYQPKWDELGNDVVEVDTRYFINQKFKNNIPEFGLIYSDGECFIKSYSRTDYEEVIAKRKAEWKRQDKINYKIQWERLDWFWKYLHEYKVDKTILPNLIKAFNKLSLEDMGACWDLVFNKSSCFKDIKEQIREIINESTSTEFDIYISEQKEKYKDILVLNGLCTEKVGMEISWSFTKEYSLFENTFHNSVFIQDRRWIIHPETLCAIKNDFSEEDISIKNHIKNIKKINDYLYSNPSFVNLLSLRDNEDIYIYLDEYKFDLFDNYINDDDVNHITDRINDIFIDAACRYFSQNVQSLNCSDVCEIIETYFKKYNTLQNMFEVYDDYKWDNDEYYKIIYKGFEILKIQVTESSIKIGDNYIFFCFYDRETFCKEIYNLMNEEIKEKEFVIKNSDFIIELSRFSNNTWHFDCNKECNNIEIKLSYYVPYLNNYKKRIEVSEIVEIPQNAFMNIKLEEYISVLNNILDNYIAPTMKKMLDEQIMQYNMAHLTSIAYKSSEVKHYD